jgi:hypothetical protein
MLRKSLFLLVFCTFQNLALAQTTTANLGISKPQVGQNQPQVVISVAFDSFDSAVAGRLSKSVAGASDVTLTSTEARNAIHEYTGVLTGNINVVVPAKNKLYAVYNSTSGAFTLTVKTSAGTGIAVSQGTRVWLYCDATNVVSLGSGGSLTINSTDGRLPYRSNSTTFADSPLARVDADTMEQANSTNAQVLNIYGTKTDTSNYTRLNLHATATDVNISAGTAGTGADDLTINLIPAGTGVVSTTRAFELSEISAPATPASGKVRLYAKSDGLLYSKDDAGVESQLSGSGGSGLGDPGGNGIVARTALNTTSARTITGTANEVTVADGNGVSANPTLSLSSTFDISGKTSTKPVKTGTSDPGTCGVGELLFRTDASAGSNLKGCTSTNTWTLLGGAGGSPALSSVTDPTGNSTLDMNANLVAWTWDGNFSTSSAFKLVGANTSATGSLFHVSTGVSNNIIPVLIEPRGGQAFKITELGNVVVGAPSPISSSTSGFPYFPVIQSNAEPAGTPTSITGAVPLVIESDAVFGEDRIWIYSRSAWRNATPIGGMFASQSGTGAQTINWSTSYESVSTRQLTMSGNVTLTFTAPLRSGAVCNLILIQDATGGRTASWPASVKWPGGSAFAPDTGANAKTVYQFIYDGSNYFALGAAGPMS